MDGYYAQWNDERQQGSGNEYHPVQPMKVVPAEQALETEIEDGKNHSHLQFVYYEREHGLSVVFYLCNDLLEFIDVELLLFKEL